MARSLLSLLLLCVTFFGVFSQKIAKLSARYTFYAPESMSIGEAKNEAVRRAKLQALADVFGTRIAQTSSTHIINDGAESEVSFFTTGTNEVLGEWIETEGEPEVKVSYSDNMLVVDVFIKGKGREHARLQVPLVVKVLRNSTEDISENDKFSDGDNVYVSFQTPLKGFVLIYLLDYVNDVAYCLLPYASSRMPSIEVEPDTRYVFFSEKDAPEFFRDITDEYKLTSNGNEREHNELVVLFSSDNLLKGNTDRLSETLPRQLPLSDFNQWLAKQKISNMNLQTINKPLTINPKRL